MTRTKAALAGLLLALVALVCSAVPLTCAHADDVDEGYYQIRVNEDQSKALGFTSGYVAGGDRVILQRANADEPGQVFYLKKASAGLYELRVGFNQELTLDVVNSNYSNGTQLCAWNATGGKNQRFFLQRNSNGSYTFACQGNNSFGIDDSGGGHKLGNKVTIYSRGTTGLGSANKNQQFALVPATLPGLTHTEACKGDTITYRVSQRVNTWGVDAFVRYESFEITDELPEGVEYLSADLKQDDGTSITKSGCEGGAVSYDTKTRTVKAKLKRDFLQDADKFPLDGQTYVLEIRARIAEIPKSEQLENVGKTKVNDNPQSSNKVVTKVLEPKLEQTKEVHARDGNDERDEKGRLICKRGDTVHYVIQARQTRQGAVQWPTELTDEIPKELELDASSVKLDGPSGASVTTSGNTITMHTGRLSYDQPVRIEYDCKVLKSACGKVVKNVFGKDVPILPYGIVYYHRDGESEPVFTEIVNEEHGLDPDAIYQVNHEADKAAIRSNCSGIIGWYLDPECTQPYDPAKNGKIPAEGNIHLYTKNKVTLSYGMTNDSFPKRFPSKKYYSDEQMTKGVTITSVLPASETHYYGDVVPFANGPDIWYKSMGARQLRCSEGAYAYADGSGDLLTEARLTGNSTAWLKWGGGAYDGIWTR